MTDPNKGVTPNVLARLKKASYERFLIELLIGIEQLLRDFDMTWDDLADRIYPTKGWGLVLKKQVGDGELSLSELNDIAHIFSTEPYLIFRPRFPWTVT